MITMYFTKSISRGGGNWVFDHVSLAAEALARAEVVVAYTRAVAVERARARALV
jgi:hypothetical protein